MDINLLRKYRKLKEVIKEYESLKLRISDLECEIRKEKNRNNRLEKRIWEQDRKIQYYHNSLLLDEQYPQELAKWYFKRTGKRLDLDNPETYNEKIQWFKLYGVTPLIKELVDKYRVRQYVKERIGEEYLVPLLGVWDYPEEIDFSVLPQSFVIKANHGCKYNYIVKDKSSLNKEDFLRKANEWLDEEYAFHSGFELQYRGIPRCVIAEQYLENTDGDLYDYKMWCFNGRVEYIQFLSGRNNELKMDFYNREWQLQEFTYDYSNSGIVRERPDNLQTMIELAEKLANGFPHVRVDFYRLNDGKLYFGEMTFTSCSGVCHWNIPDFDKSLGKLFVYPGMKHGDEIDDIS